eukprot:11617585-Alexandrium_andersonii.AAC.1
MPQVDAEGRPTEDASPWLVQMREDFEAFQRFDDWASWLELLDGRLTEAFREGEIRECFLLLDPRVLRIAETKVCVPPPVFEMAPPADEVRVADGGGEGVRPGDGGGDGDTSA